LGENIRKPHLTHTVDTMINN